MSKRTRSIFLAIALLSAAATPLAAADEAEYDPDRIEFVLGNVVFVTLHEIAHTVIEDFDVPVLGNNEDAADTLAAVHLIRLDREHPEQNLRLIRMLLITAGANRILWQRGLEENNPAFYLTRHPLSVQRAARIACLVYGSEPDVFESLPDLVGLPEFRADWCDEEYADAEQAWSWVRENYVLVSSGTATDHEYIYGAARQPGHETIRNWLMNSRVLEQTLAQVDATKMLHDRITIRTLSCGSPDAYWDRDERELVVCYELIQTFHELSADQGIRDLEDKISAFHRDNRASKEN